MYFSRSLVAQICLDGQIIKRLLKIRCDWRCCIGQILKECQTTPPVIKEISDEQNQGTVKLSSVQVSDAHLALF